MGGPPASLVLGVWGGPTFRAAVDQASRHGQLTAVLPRQASGLWEVGLACLRGEAQDGLCTPSGQGACALGGGPHGGRIGRCCSWSQVGAMRVRQWLWQRVLVPGS